MFEVTIRTDNQAALRKLMEFLATLDLKIVKPPKSQNGKNTSMVNVEIQMKEEPPAPDKGKQRKIVNWGGMEVDVSDVKRGFGCAKGMIELAPDWDEPLEDFKEYM